MIGSPLLPTHAPRVAVIVPAYGVAHLVGEALTSLQGQTLTDWECVVIDDGAPDDVACAVAPFLTDPRIRFLATDNQGVSAARNRAVQAAQAPLVALLDGDDLLRPAYLETMVPLLEADPSLRLATCNARLFGSVPRERLCIEQTQGKTDGLHGTLADVLDRSFNVYIGTTFRRADFDRIGGFDTTMAQSEDFDLWVRLMMLGGRARCERDSRRLSRPPRLGLGEQRADAGGQYPRLRKGRRRPALRCARTGAAGAAAHANPRGSGF